MSDSRKTTVSVTVSPQQLSPFCAAPAASAVRPCPQKALPDLDSQPRTLLSSRPHPTGLVIELICLVPVSPLQGVLEAWGHVSLSLNIPGSICGKGLWVVQVTKLLLSGHETKATTHLPDFISCTHLRNGNLGLMVCVSET